MQLSLWGKVKSKGDWTDELLGLFDGDKLVGTVMLLHRKIPFIGGYLYYAPRGFIVDFDDFSLVEAFTKEIYKYLRTKRLFIFSLTLIIITEFLISMKMRFPKILIS